ncbi:TY-Chap domain-containing protein [Dactylosporangium sp. CA-092794]|uniref:TY-Chap domain-containing protein n=1 Tax=Dactylosporangium sp. CA-092794 TaxID=3239929 RepID=UPI003D8CB267
MTAPTWDEFRAALARELARLGDGVFVVLNVRARPWHYAQFHQGRSHLDAEVAGEASEDSDEMAETPAGRALIESLGWAPPQPPDAPAWSKSLPWPLTGREYRALVDAVVRVLREVNGVGGPAELEYRAWEGRQGNRPWAVDLPGVGRGESRYGSRSGR